VTVRQHDLGKDRRQTFGIGLLKGMGVTLKHLFKHNTVIQYPDEKQDLPARTRGVIALKEENCTVCMLCGRECPDWCIYIDSHKETLPPKREGGRPRKRNVLDRFAIDYALCMYCGICVEVCPYDALFWSREFEYAEYDIRELTHEKERLSDWMATVLPPPELESGADLAGGPAAAGAAGPGSAQRPSPPAQVTATEQRPQQAPREPGASATAAPAPQRATAAQEQAGEVRAEASSTPPEATEQKADAGAARAGTDGDLAERVPADHGARATRPVAEATADAEAAYRAVLEDQLAKGSSPQVAEARARVARVKAQRGLRLAPPSRAGQAPTEVAGEPATVPSGAPRGAEPEPDQGPVAPEPSTAAPPTDGAPPGAPEASDVDAPARSGLTEDPDAAYERVLVEERAKGSSDAVAVARAKAARVRATKGTKGPAG
jgi:formate hydrogenlyase subunit 6/NADH:ubiquinone oxidoreductase subunit I